VIFLFIWMIASFTRAHWSFGNVLFRTWLFLILSGLATGLSWLCYFRALQLGEASRVAPMDKLSVLFAILFAVIVLRETLTWHQWLGGGLVLTGAVILALK
jgi:transporter family protein